MIFGTLELLLFNSTLDVSEKSLFCVLASFCCFGCFILKGSPFTDSLPGLLPGGGGRRVCELWVAHYSSLLVGVEQSEARISCTYPASATSKTASGRSEAA